jgi:hypothetical protein
MSKNTIITSVCLAVVVAGLGYYFFFFNNSDGPAISASSGSASDAELSFITLVSKIDPIVFDTSLLSDPRFVSRQDIKTSIIPETSGRRDPFAPIGR